ncbi:helix-turn-helix domain-containing protein [Streptomyces clavifer]|uniref:helix-turn-helix domain-containing protein n=1 Tax=Streptomyces clavifer TaxID=68188 RepID=UPI003673FCF4
MQELLDRARAGHVLDALGMLTALSVHTEPLLRDALIQQARLSGATSSQMAARMGVSTTVFARRYTASAVGRRLASPRPAEIYRAAREISLPPRQGTLPTDPALLLAQALGGLVEHAQRGKPGDKFRTRQNLAAEAGVHPSYLSRIIMGKRRPSWGTAYRITMTCRGDVSAIRSLWEAAAYSESTQETTPASAAAQRPSTLQDLLLGLFLAAGQPTEWEIAGKGGGEVEDIQAILDGRVVSWDAVSKFSTALGLDPSAAHPLWTLAQSSQPSPAESTEPVAEGGKIR